MKQRTTWLGVILVLIGLVLILDRSGLVAFGGAELFWGAVAVVGCAFLYRGWKGAVGGKIFWGTLFLAVGVLEVLEHAQILDIAHLLWMPIFALAVGVALALRFIRTPREWHLVVPAITFVGLGTSLWLVDAGVIPHDEFLNGLWLVGPLALVVFGAALLARSRTT